MWAATFPERFSDLKSALNATVFGLSPAKISQKAIIFYWGYIKSMACMDPDRDLDPVQWSNEVCEEQQEQVLKPRNKLPGEQIWMDFSMIA